MFLIALQSYSSITGYVLWLYELTIIKQSKVQTPLVKIRIMRETTLRPQSAVIGRRAGWRWYCWLFVAAVYVTFSCTVSMMDTACPHLKERPVVGNLAILYRVQVKPHLQDEHVRSEILILFISVRLLLF